MNFILFDLELTCWEGDMAGRVQEIIEIGAIKINSRGHVKSQFSKFVKPALFPILSPYCLELTTISQHEINLAKPFPIVFAEFINWIEFDPDPYYLVAWGHQDRGYLTNDLQLHRMDSEGIKEIYFDLNLKYSKMKKLRDPVGLNKALAMEGLEFEGTPHRAIDDTQNMLRIFKKYFEAWDLYKVDIQ